MTKRLFTTLLTLAFSITLAAQSPSYQEEIDAWRKTRVERLTREDGWVTLAGLFWLSEGENSFGRLPQNRLIANYPEFPDCAGYFIVKDQNVTFKAHPGVPVLSDGQAVTELTLKSDQEGKPTLLNHGSFNWFLIQRGERLGVRFRWQNHPNRAKLKEIPAFPCSESWRISGQFVPYNSPRKMVVDSVIGSQSEEDCPGEIRFQIKGKDFVLYPTGTIDQMGLIFGDSSNGQETYVGGRFLPLTAPDEQGRIVLDFNKAYNPPCVFSPFATCPIPNEENTLNIAIEAGEKMVHLFQH